MRRVYECTNGCCDQFGAKLEVMAVERGPFHEWPQLRCVCGTEPRIVESDESTLYSLDVARRL